MFYERDIGNLKKSDTLIVQQISQGRLLKRVFLHALKTILPLKASKLLKTLP